MVENIIYSVKDKELEKIEKYLGKHSYEYSFSAKKGEEKSIYFMDNNKKIFAIINPIEKEVELSSDINEKIINGIEKLINFGRKR